MPLRNCQGVYIREEGRRYSSTRPPVLACLTLISPTGIAGEPVDAMLVPQNKKSAYSVCHERLAARTTTHRIATYHSRKLSSVAPSSIGVSGERVLRRRWNRIRGLWLTTVANRMSSCISDVCGCNGFWTSPTCSPFLKMGVKVTTTAVRLPPAVHMH